MPLQVGTCIKKFFINGTFFFHQSVHSHDSFVILKWLDDKESPIRDPPIQMMRKLDLLQFYLLKPSWTSYIKITDDSKFLLKIFVK